MSVPWKAITKFSLIFSFVASALIWLPLLNSLAAGGQAEATGNLLFSTIFAQVGILSLIWLNWALRRRK